ncbi:futalosine hydrolase [Streptomyces hygroscopicus subsp. hygroscopicus]|uniref:futalosine hydrolase n=1 Tax=Streptomyces hygroscopicus TaxID=1912 RepID=UPI0007672E0E|nr:futalosine hydrolase [Streptomyces hygroscopicus]MBW8088426.1 futalosine hydrolase [Streptomyces hygroscopicus subsp. hygroscopicus]
MRVLIVTAVPAERDAVVRGVGATAPEVAELPVPGGVIHRLSPAPPTGPPLTVDVLAAGVGPAAAAAGTAAALTAAAVARTPYDLAVSAGIGGGFGTPRPGAAHLAPGTPHPLPGTPHPDTGTAPSSSAALPGPDTGPGHSRSPGTSTVPPDTGTAPLGPPDTDTVPPGPGTVPLGSIVVADAIVAADLGAETPDGFTAVTDLGFGTVEHLPPAPLVAAVAEATNAVRGTVLTVSTVTGSAERAAELLRRHPRAAAEAMEGFGVAEAAAAQSVPVLEVRAVSNTVGPRDRAAWRIGEALEALTGAFGTLAPLLPLLGTWTSDPEGTRQ